MFRRHGKTPIDWLHAIGALGRQTIIGHGIFLDHHPWLHWPTGDMRLLRDTGATVAHCPTVFMRRGIAMNTFGAYAREASISASAPTPIRTISSRRCAAPSPSRARSPAPSTT